MAEASPRFIVRSLRSNARSFIRCKEKVSESITHDSPNLTARTIAPAITNRLPRLRAD